MIRSTCLVLIAVVPACVDTEAPVEVPEAPPAPILYNECNAEDCPFMLTPLVLGETTDAWRVHGDLPVAVNGTYELTYETYTDPGVLVRTEIEGGFTSKIDTHQAVTVRATRLGSAAMTVTSYAPYGNTEVIAPTRTTIDVRSIDEVRFDLPRYVSLTGEPLEPTVVGSSFVGAIRLVDADGQFLADHSLRVTGEGASTQRWDGFAIAGLAPGRHAVTVEADSLAAPVRVSIDVIDQVDDIILTDTREPSPSYWHQVCAHAFARGVEVMTPWQMTAESFAWIPADAGNCIEVIPGTGKTATATFVAANGATKQITISE
jgi:hypothetical protein